MSVRILGGIAKGFSLAVPPESITRPTSVMLKRRLFDAQQSFADAQFIDACAGSGSIGLEAWSRGACAVWLVEPHGRAHRVLQNNYSNWSKRFAEELQTRPVHCAQVNILNWWQKTGRELVESFEGPTFFYFDPPYEEHDLYRELAAQLSSETFASGGALWIQSDGQKGLGEAEIHSLFGTHKAYKQGHNFIAVHHF